MQQVDQKSRPYTLYVTYTHSLTIGFTQTSHIMHP